MHRDIRDASTPPNVLRRDMASPNGAWCVKRPHGGDGVAGDGSADSTAIATRRESGLDEAVRFDGITRLMHGGHA